MRKDTIILIGIFVAMVALFAGAFIYYNNYTGKKGPVHETGAGVATQQEQTVPGEGAGKNETTTLQADTLDNTLNNTRETTVDTAANQTASEKTAGIEEGVMPGFRAPDFQLEDLKGKKVKLSDYRGKIVFLNFWATWCPYCVEELPEFQKQHDIFSKDGDVVILAVDIGESRDQVASYIKSKKLDMNFLLDINSAVAGKYFISGIPATFVIDRQGIIVNVVTGPVSGEKIDNYINRINNRQ